MVDGASRHDLPPSRPLVFNQPNRAQQRGGIRVLCHRRATLGGVYVWLDTGTIHNHPKIQTPPRPFTGEGLGERESNLVQRTKPDVVSLREAYGLSWIPAFAGMTKLGNDEIRE